MFKAIPKLAAPYLKLFSPRIRMLRHNPLLSKRFIEGFLLRRKLLCLHAAFTPSRIFLLERQHTIQLGIISPYSKNTQIQIYTHLIWQMRVTALVQSVVMHASLNMGRFLYDQVFFVHRQLSFYGVPFLLAAVMRFPFMLVLWPGDLLALLHPEKL